MQASGTTIDEQQHNKTSAPHSTHRGAGANAHGHAARLDQSLALQGKVSGGGSKGELTGCMGMDVPAAGSSLRSAPGAAPQHTQPGWPAPATNGTYKNQAHLRIALVVVAAHDHGVLNNE